ncbi:MAG TPA: hypothetical protein VMA35_08715 [Candidatus Sulfopaludibacter sp.]|nr:hypothetical protein [Candidatus Sulfopaludibacter sp.]
MFRKRCLRDLGCAVALFGVFCGNAPGQLPLPAANLTRSVSGQFVVTDTGPGLPGSPLAASATNSDLVRLEPALLAVSAERIKQTLWRELGVDPATPWRGRIFLGLHPARSLDENVTVFSEHFVNGWDYQVALPDVLPRVRFVRALTSVVLLEFANRGAGTQSAEIPAWLTDGLSQQLLATGAVEVVLSSPGRTANGLAESRLIATERGLDPLADARGVLRNHPVLTFEQLNWPTEAQVSGADGGVYRASAQLFVGELLKLSNGRAHLRAMLQASPRYFNWQTAFQNAFRADFARPLDVEKWWALQVIDFVARDPGPTWTPAVSRENLDQILDVPVDFRTASNALPVYAEVSLQAVIRNLDSERQMVILQTKLRDLELAQLRMARPLAILTAGYRAALADYLGQSQETAPAPPFGKHPLAALQKADAAETLKKLDALDAQRRAVESSIKPDIWRP